MELGNGRGVQIDLRASVHNLDPKDQALIEAARSQIRDRYKENRHHIAAALRTRSGKIHTGIHLDTYVGRASVCAEAVAVGKAMAADPTWKRRILETPKIDRVSALAEYGVTLKILGTVRAPDQWAAAGELRKRLLEAFREHGIEIPRPQRVVLAREPGGLPPPDESMAATLDGE